MSVLLRPVLVLDAGYQAVNVVPMRRALSLLATGKAVPVEEDPGTIYRSERMEVRRPTIIRLFIAVAHRVYRTLSVRFNKKNILARDGHRCAYCGAGDSTLTVDHVFPRSRSSPEHPLGGSTSWENCVAACVPCNARKGNRTPQEAGMELRVVPKQPRWMLPALLRRPGTRVHPQWGRYLV